MCLDISRERLTRMEESEAQDPEEEDDAAEDAPLEDD
jgi:hypothetical protein